MADVDHKSGLPVRSESDGADEKVVVKIVDGTPGGSNQVAVDSDKNAHVEMHGNDPAGVDRVARLAENGAVQSDGVYDVAANTKPSHQGLVLQERNAAAADSRQTMRPTAKRGTVDTDRVSQDVALHDENGNGYTRANPVPVAVYATEYGTPKQEHYESASAVAKDATDTRTYTVAGTAFVLKKIHTSASGRFKLEVLVGPSGSEVRKFVKFASSADPNADVVPATKIEVAVGDNILIKMTNLDQQAFTVYSTIEGENA